MNKKSRGKNYRARRAGNSESPIIKISIAIIGAVSLIIAALINRAAVVLPIKLTQTAQVFYTSVALTTQANQPSVVPGSPTPAYSDSIVTMNNFFTWINNAESPDDLVNSWRLETSGSNGYQCRENAGCDFGKFKDWWWRWKVQYALYECSPKIVEASLYFYDRDPILASTPSGPFWLRYELVDIQGDLKINQGDTISGPSAGCKRKISGP